MSSIAAIGAQQAIQQAVASMKSAAQSQQAAAEMLVQAVETGQLAKVNEAKIEAIVSSLEDQADIAKQSDAKLQQLIEIMLTKE